MKQSTVAILLPLILVLSILSALIYASSPTPHSPWNKGPSGTSALLANLSAKPVNELNGDLCNSTVVIILDKNLDSQTVNETVNLLECGTRIIIGDKYGRGLNLYSRLGLGIEYSNETVLDEVYKYQYRWILKVKARINGSSYDVIVPNATYIEPTIPPNYIIAQTSDYAYVDTDGNGYYSLGDQMGSYPIIVGYRVGRGTIIIVPSNEFFINKYIRLGDNLRFTEALSNGSNVYLYLGSLKLSPIDYIKEPLYSWIQGRGKYDWVAGLIASAIVTIPWSYNYLQDGRRRKYLFFIAYVIAAAPYIIEGVKNNTLVYIIPAVAPLIVYSFSWLAGIGLVAAIGMVASSFNPVYILFYLATLLFMVPLSRSFPGQGVLGSSTLSLLTLQAMNLLAVLVYPGVLLTLTIASLAFLFAAVAVYVFLLRSVIIREPRAPGEVYFGSRVPVAFEVSSNNGFRYYLSTNGELKEGFIEPGRWIVYKFTPKHLGVNRIVLTLYISDETRLAWRYVGTYTIRVNVLPLSSKMLSRAGALLAGLRSTELLSKISMAILLMAEESGEGRVLTRREDLEKFALEAEKRLGSKGVGPGRLVARLVEEFLKATERASTRTGTYFGAREYTCGDSIRDIHWKKTLSKLKLISKEYRDGSEGAAGSPGGGDLLLVADLDCTSNTEIDSVLMKTIGLLVDIASRSPEGELSLLLIMKRHGVVMKGASAAVLNLFYNTLKSAPAGSQYNYRSMNRYFSVEEIEFMSSERAPLLVQRISSVFARDSALILSALAESKISPPMRFKLFHCRASASWASFLIYALINSGYKYEGDSGS